MATCSFAGVLTVDNNTNSAAQYTSLQSAINAAVAGDTIYVSGSTLNYGNATINKRLTLFGTGYNPIKQQPLTSMISTFFLDSVNSVSGSSGSLIAGFYIATITDNSGAKNVRMERNYFTSGISFQASASGCVLRNNLIYASITINNCTNLLIENNILYQSTTYYSNQPSILISHNLFMGNIGGGHYSQYQVSSATLLNNIYWGTSPLGTFVSGLVMNNNLTFQTPNDAIPGGANSGSGNLVTINPQFVNAPSPGLNFAYDYNVSGASAANNAGTDGTDLGVFGGASPMPNLTGMPPIPQMVEMTVNTPVIAPGANLNVTFKAKKNN
jgi:hypothetical protein